MDERSEPTEKRGIDRRTFLRYGAYTGAAVVASPAVPTFARSAAATSSRGAKVVTGPVRAAASRAIKSFEFEELSAGVRHEEYLWGNPAFACVCVLGQAFSEDAFADRWRGQISAAEIDLQAGECCAACTDIEHSA